MNNSNRYGIESMARQRQAEIERQLRRNAELASLKPGRASPLLKGKWAAIGAAVISLLGTVALLVISHVR